MEQQPFYMDQIIVYKKGEETPMLISSHIPAGKDVEFNERMVYPEGIWNVLKLTFKVNAPVKGVVCHRKVYKLGICVNTEDEPIGDFEPREEPYFHLFPEVETPSGFFVRGMFNVVLKFTDATGNTIYTIKYPFEIVKKV